MIVPYLYIGYLARRTAGWTNPCPARTLYILLGGTALTTVGALLAQSTDCISMGEWTLGPLSILLDAATGFLFIRLFMRLNRFTGPIAQGLQAIGRNSLNIFCIHTVELIAIPWYLFAAHFTDHPLRGMLLQNVIAFTSIGLVCALLNCGARWIVKAYGRTAAGPGGAPPRFHSIDFPGCCGAAVSYKTRGESGYEQRCPQTLDAAGSRVAELEQQLRLSDEGVSRLAQRCLELEQQVLKYEAVLVSQGADTEQGALLLPQLFYDSGSGFSPHECLTVAPDSYDELTHEVSAVFELPVEARACVWTPVNLPAASPIFPSQTSGSATTSSTATPCRRHHAVMNIDPT